jgi:hypothetical protein
MKTTKRSSIKIQVYFIHSIYFDSSFFPSVVKAGSESSGMDLGDLLHLLDSSSFFTKDGTSATPSFPSSARGFKDAARGYTGRPTTIDGRLHLGRSTTRSACNNN